MNERTKHITRETITIWLDWTRTYWARAKTLITSNYQRKYSSFNANLLKLNDVMTPKNYDFTQNDLHKCVCVCFLTIIFSSMEWNDDGDRNNNNNNNRQPRQQRWTSECCNIKWFFYFSESIILRQHCLYLLYIIWLFFFMINAVTF